MVQKTQIKLFLIIVAIVVLFYMFFLNGANNIRAIFEERFYNSPSPVVDCYFGYIKSGLNVYEKKYEIHASEINYLAVPSSTDYLYFLFGDLRNGNKITAFVNGEKIKKAHVHMEADAKFWESIYLRGYYVITLPTIEKNKRYEISLISGNRIKEYIIQSK
ncbi:MAG: hypothetical protein PHU66_11035 [Bacteroidaceae bacterium]|nr:hypothetical protein [Bacteroidaceae bacterium]